MYLFSTRHRIYLVVFVTILLLITCITFIIFDTLRFSFFRTVSLQQPINVWETNGRVYSLAYSPDGQFLASVETLTRDFEHEEYVVRLRKVLSGEIVNTLGGQNKRIYALAFSLDGSMLAVGDEEGRIQVWRIANGTLLASMEGHSEPIQQVVFAPNATSLLSVSDDYSLREWSIPNGTAQHSVLWSKYYTCGIANAVFVGNEARFAVREATTIVLYSYSSQEVIQSIQAFDRSTCNDFEKVDVHLNTNATMLASIDALDGRKSSIRLWDLRTGQLQATMNGHTDKIMSVAFSPNNEFLASASGVPYYALHTDGDLSVRIWRTSDGKAIGILDNAHYGAIVGLTFSPDSYILASGGVDGKIRFWQLPTSE